MIFRHTMAELFPLRSYEVIEGTSNGHQTGEALSWRNGTEMELECLMNLDPGFTASFT